MVNAWVITWEGMDRRISDENRVVAVLSNRLSSSFVEDLIDVLYQRCRSSVMEMAHFANRRKERRRASRMLFSSGERIFYGTADQFLYGRRVSNFTVKESPGREVENIRWIERPLCKQNPNNGYSVELVEEAKTVEIARPSRRTLERVFGA